MHGKCSILINKFIKRTSFMLPSIKDVFKKKIASITELIGYHLITLHRVDQFIVYLSLAKLNCGKMIRSNNIRINLICRNVLHQKLRNIFLSYFKYMNKNAQRIMYMILIKIEIIPVSYKVLEAKGYLFVIQFYIKKLFQIPDEKM